MLVHKYELFRMENSESITEMFTRFTDIINGLKSLGRSYSNSDLVRKILRSLPRAWKAKVTAIQEAKDLNSLLLEELLGSLMTYELSMKQNLEEDEPKKRRTIALKSTLHEDESEDFESENSEEMALITRRFKKFFRRNRENFKKRPIIKGPGAKQRK